VSRPKSAQRAKKERERWNRRKAQLLARKKKQKRNGGA